MIPRGACLPGIRGVNIPKKSANPMNKEAESRLAALLPQAHPADLETAAMHVPARLPYLLAARFDYDVRQGGFSQLLYNMRGKLLANIEDMLIAANASVAHEYYVRAITACLSNKPEYRRFLASDYTEPNEVKHALQMISVDYLSKRVAFSDEVAAFMANDDCIPEG